MKLQEYLYHFELVVQLLLTSVKKIFFHISFFKIELIILIISI